MVASHEPPHPVVIDLAADWDVQLPEEPDPAIAGWVATSWSPDGRWIAVSTSERLGRMDPETYVIEDLLGHGFWPEFDGHLLRLVVRPTKEYCTAGRVDIFRIR